jgi:hypothetical protein
MQLLALNPTLVISDPKLTHAWFASACMADEHVDAVPGGPTTCRVSRYVNAYSAFKGVATPAVGWQLQPGSSVVDSPSYVNAYNSYAAGSSIGKPPDEDERGGAGGAAAANPPRKKKERKRPPRLVLADSPLPGEGVAFDLQPSATESTAL